MTDYYVACRNCGHPLVIRSILGKVWIWDYKKRWCGGEMQTKCPNCGLSINEAKK